MIFKYFQRKISHSSLAGSKENGHPMCLSNRIPFCVSELLFSGRESEMILLSRTHTSREQLPTLPPPFGATVQLVSSPLLSVEPPQFFSAFWRMIVTFGMFPKFRINDFLYLLLFQVGYPRQAYSRLLDYG